MNESITRPEEVFRTIVGRSVQGINYNIWHPDVDFFPGFVPIRNYPVSRDVRFRKPSRTPIESRVAHDQNERLWLTTNDNEPAIRFYQQRGMHIAAIRHGAIAESHKLKPEISF